MSPIMVFRVLYSGVFQRGTGELPSVLFTVIFRVRIPRVIAAMLVGGALSISGASFQGLFRNPLVSPHILGVSAGAGFGAALAILYFEGTAMIAVFAFVFGLIAVGIAYTVGRSIKANPTLTLVLSGIVVGAFFQSLTALLKYTADPYDKLPSIVFWLMGSLSGVKVNQLLYVAPIIISSVLVLLMIRWRINVMSLGDEEAEALGVDTQKSRSIIIIFSTIAVASAVCISGIIGWVGLVIPHVGRMLVGPDHKILLPTSFSIGMVYLLFIDNIARTLTTAEIPLGILTGIIGAPFFIYLLRRRRAGWQ